MKLTKDQREKMVSQYKSGTPIVDIARKNNVSYTYTWKLVTSGAKNKTVTTKTARNNDVDTALLTAVFNSNLTDNYKIKTLGALLQWR